MNHNSAYMDVVDEETTTVKCKACGAIMDVAFEGRHIEFGCEA